MKRSLIRMIILQTAVFFASVSCIDYVETVPGESAAGVSFEALLDNPVKAPVMGQTFPTSRTVILSAHKNGAEDAQEWFVDIPFAYDGTAWTANPQKRWPHQGTLDFLAWSADGLSMTASHPSNVSSAVTLAVPDNSSAQSDILVGARAGRSAQEGPFTMVFKHAEALVTFSAHSAEAYDAAANVGATLTGVRLIGPKNSGTLAVTRNGDDVAFAWSALGTERDALVSGDPVHLTTSSVAFGQGFLLPPQNAVWFAVQYTIHGGRDANGDPVDCPLEYVYHAGGSWDAGWRYNYDLSFSDNDIVVRATLEEWRMTGNYFYGTADHVDLVGPNFDFTSVTDWMWRPTEDDPYQRLTFDGGTWGSSVDFLLGGWGVTVASSGGSLTLSYVDVARSTPLTLDVMTDGEFSTEIAGLEYRVDGGAWTAYSAPFAVTAGMRLQLRADGTGGERINCDGNYSASGNVLSMISKEGFAELDDIPADGLSGLFRAQSHLVSASGLRMPGGAIGARGCRSMFKGCVSMVTGPEIPATSAEQYACDSMFLNCSRLRKGPTSLPATLGTSGGRQFTYMFYGCTSLTVAPELPATSIPTYAYYCMFYGCTALTTAPELPATTVSTYGYSYMFYGCSALATPPPVLPAETMNSACYYYMFASCTSLTRAPEMHGKTLGSNCYAAMFSSCSRLADIPASIPAEGGSSTVSSSACQSMFSNCKALTHAPALPATTLGEECYRTMFNGCTSLVAAPDLPAPVVNVNSYNGMFSGCSRLEAVKILATDISAYGCLSNWLSGVAAAGTITKHPDAALPAGASGIPSGWTVVEATE